MQRLLEYVSPRAIESSIASWKVCLDTTDGYSRFLKPNAQILLAAAAICPCLLMFKLIFISIAKALTTNKEGTPMPAEQAAKIAGQISNVVERSEESSQLLENTAQLDQRLTMIHRDEVVSRDGLSGHRFTPEDEQESSSHSTCQQLNAHTDLLPQTHSRFNNSLAFSMAC
ncbi:hypothetical protein BYT27DRAFT_6839368 [Phlegmacium glaucopus]|nr:hypothetical protein BYT27DRAFT_6839368 [Phlegmacium glaucopus]